MFILFALFACTRHAEIEKRITHNDSARTKIRVERLLYYDTITVQIPEQHSERVTRDSNSILENSVAISKAGIDSAGRLWHTLQTKQTGLHVAAPREIITRDSIIYRTVLRDAKESTEKPEKPEKPEKESILGKLKAAWISCFWIVLYLFATRKNNGRA